MGQHYNHQFSGKATPLLAEEALDEMSAFLSAEGDWDASTIEGIADLVRATGRTAGNDDDEVEEESTALRNFEELWEAINPDPGCDRDERFIDVKLGATVLIEEAGAYDSTWIEVCDRDEAAGAILASMNSGEQAGDLCFFQAWDLATGKLLPVREVTYVETDDSQAAVAHGFPIGEYDPHLTTNVEREVAAYHQRILDARTRGEGVQS